MKRTGSERMWRNILLAVFIFFGFVWLCVWSVNLPAVQQRLVSVLNDAGKARMSLKAFRWKPLESKFVIAGLDVNIQSSGRSFHIDSAVIGYRPLGFLRGKLLLDDVAVSGAKLSIPKSAVPEKPKNRMNMARLILLKNLELDSCSLNDVELSFGGGMKFSAESASVSMETTLLGKTRLEVAAFNFSLAKGEKMILQANELEAKTSTALSSWRSGFPFINDFSGSVLIKEARVRQLGIEEAGADMSFNDGLIELRDAGLAIGGRKLAGKLLLNLGDESYDIEVSIKDPVPIEHFGAPLITFETAGTVAGSVKLKGAGFKPAESSGSGEFDVTYAFRASPDSPLSARSNVTLEKGVFTFDNARAKAGDYEFGFEGMVNVPAKKMRFAAKGEKFPLEYIFEKFKIVHLKKIFGPTDFEGSFEGWAKDFEARVTGTTYNGGWRPITAEVVKTEFTASYDDMDLKGAISDGGKETGRAHLHIKYGGLLPDGTRAKDIAFKADIKDQPLAVSMQAYKLTGLGTGNISIVGPHLSFKGESEVAVENGSWLGAPFEHAQAKMNILPKKVELDDIFVSMNGSGGDFAGKMAVAILSSEIRLTGTPIENFSLDAGYRHADASWDFKKLEWRDATGIEGGLAISGTYKERGPVNLSLKGNPDLKLLDKFAPSIARGQRPVDVDVSIKGSGDEPAMFGNVTFHENTLSLRPLRMTIEGITGSLNFDGRRVRFEDINGDVEDGHLQLRGFIDIKGWGMGYADATLSGRGMRYRSEDNTLNMELEGNAAMKGAFPSPHISGDMKILDGRYTKDFSIIEAISGGAHKARKEPSEVMFAAGKFNPTLALHIQSMGEMEIKNNVGEVWLIANVDVKGTKAKPIIAGSIDTTYGKINYLGANFDITKGFMEFRERDASPYLEIYAQKELGTYNVNVTLHGHTDNLAIVLSATSPSGSLEKRDIVSLILFGMTEQEIAEQSKRTGDQFTRSMATRSISNVMERPVTKFTHLDVFRLEAGDQGNTSRIYVGKKLTDRLSFNFATDLNADDAVQTVIGEYLLTDNLLIRSARSSDGQYEFGGALRFNLR